ncbi:MAG: hypothetical protein PSV36_16705 [Algoriphagus sp.]|nr:hypothetical protein [Algoriphagus sp.]
MKNSILLFAIASLLVAGCGNKNTEDHAHDAEGNHVEEGTHQHEDGAVHEDHTDSVTQEEFTAPADSAAKAAAEHGHEHKVGEKH